MTNLSFLQPKKILAYEYSLGDGPGIKVTDTQTSAPTQLEDIISMVIGFLTVIAVIYFLIQIILAGYAFISGQGDEKKIETARKKLTDGILGLTIVVIAFGVTAFISNLLGLSNIFDLNSFIESIQPGSSTSGAAGI